jgi:hypothetical protein
MMGEATMTLKRYRLIEAGHHYDTVEAEDADVALEIARANVDACNYEHATSTLRIDLCVIAEDDCHDSARDTVAVAPSGTGAATTETTVRVYEVLVDAESSAPCCAYTRIVRFTSRRVAERFAADKSTHGRPASVGEPREVALRLAERWGVVPCSTTG